MRLHDMKTSFNISAKSIFLKTIAVGCMLAMPLQVNAVNNINVNANYRLTMAGFKLGSVGLAARLKTKGYAISIRAFTTGGLEQFMSFTVETRARGVYNGHKINSTEYITAYSNKRVKRKVVVTYPNNSRVTVEATPQYRRFKDAVPLHAKHLRNVVDPLGAMLLPFNKKYASNSASQCNRVQPVFDGAIRYKLTMSAASNNSKKFKNAIACRVTYTPVAGHRKGKGNKTLIDGAASAKVWLMPLEKAGVLLPVMVEIGTKFGTFKVISDSVTVGGQKLSF